jgi:hypothetical protein
MWTYQQLNALSEKKNVLDYIQKENGLKRLFKVENMY